MSTYVGVECELGGRRFQIETGLLARQANGSALVTYGETCVLVTVTCGGQKVEEVVQEEMLPLIVDYREKSSAAGKIPGGFIKREGRPSTKEILTSRLIDRPLRPLFPKGFINEVQIVATVLSADRENDPDILAMNGASSALLVSDLPFYGPVGTVRVGLIGDRFILNPTYQELQESKLDLVVTGNMEGVVMVEAGANEVSEEKIVEAMTFAHIYIRELIKLQLDLRSKAGKQTMDFTPYTVSEQLYRVVRERYEQDMRGAFFVPGKKERSKALKEVYDRMVAELCGDEGTKGVNQLIPSEQEIKMAYDMLECELVRSFAMEGKRADGRGPGDIRPISIRIGLLSRAHGSAIFTRGETQALVTVTLGTQQDEQIVDGLQDEYSKKFMLHYNFPPFCVGDVKPLRAPGRREIGHGALAERAIQPVIPEHRDFPYTIRIVSDILESNGSSSMASVCGATLSLMDAGVKIKAPVAGIAMGLIKEGQRYCVLTDILGSEDRHGDMDFKVAGTQAGITALQMDLKTSGIDFDIIRDALGKARDARLYVLERMRESISEPRAELSVHAPKLIRLIIDPEKIGLLIGPGGKTVKEIQQKTGATLEIAEDGVVIISAKDMVRVRMASEMVEAIVEDLKVGRIYRARVTSLKDFGAFIEVIPTGQEGLLHISEISEGFVRRVEDYLRLGQEIDVKIVSFDDQGRPRFSLKAARRDPSPEGLQV